NRVPFVLSKSGPPNNVPTQKEGELHCSPRPLAERTELDQAAIEQIMFTSRRARTPICFSAKSWVAMGRNFVQRQAKFRLVFACRRTSLEELAVPAKGALRRNDQHQ